MTSNTSVNTINTNTINTRHKRENNLSIIIILAGLAILALMIAPIVEQMFFKPVYVSESYKDPVYGNIYTGSIDIAQSELFGLGYSIRTNFYYQSDNVNYNIAQYRILEEYSAYGARLYVVQIFYTGGSSNIIRDVFKVNLDQVQGITGYTTRTRQVCVRNCK